MKKILKDNKAFVLIIALVLIVLVGATYAYVTVRQDGNNVNKIIAGDLSVSFDDSSSDTISLTNTYPLTDTEGLQTTEYVFTMKNDGNLPNNYIVYLDDVTTATNKMSYSVIKYNLKKQVYNSDKTLKTSTSDMKLLSEAVDEYGLSLDYGSLQPGEYITYTLQMWMDYDAGNEHQGTAFTGNIRVVANQQQ